jgi:hypothetical protein
MQRLLFHFLQCPRMTIFIFHLHERLRYAAFAEIIDKTTF